MSDLPPNSCGQKSLPLPLHGSVSVLYKLVTLRVCARAHWITDSSRSEIAVLTYSGEELTAHVHGQASRPP